MAKTRTRQAKAKAISVARMRPGSAQANTVARPLDQFVRAAAHALGLPLEPPWLAAVTANLEANLRFAAMVSEFPLPEESEPAPVFSA